MVLIAWRLLANLEPVIIPESLVEGKKVEKSIRDSSHFETILMESQFKSLEVMH